MATKPRIPLWLIGLLMLVAATLGWVLARKVIHFHRMAELSHRLADAVRRGQVAEVRMLLGEGADPAHPETKGGTPKMMAESQLKRVTEEEKEMAEIRKAGAEGKAVPNTFGYGSGYGMSGYGGYGDYGVYGYGIGSSTDMKEITALFEEWERSHEIEAGN